MQRYRLTLEYNGAPFVGWQRQENGLSIQEALETALARLGEDARVTGAGRTDRGVHALAQTAHVDLARNWQPFRLMEALNHHLRPAPIAVLEARRTGADFHARYSARRRYYLYRIIQRRAPLALEAGLAWHVRYPLDLDAMREGAAALIGHHDFTTFRSVQCQSASPIKTLDAIEIDQRGSEISICLNARSFLHNQVRSIVGTLERVGAGRWRAGRVAEVLAARDRTACGPVAPPEGLYLAGVDYPMDSGG
ncbi:MAG TPA: tRNA pseudouridine(38-40) synthase TruA [Paracoccaceae bacterium]|nr:tRNA pseudouridine(38-40) synthase TruA [Paracoccaceae bacterium]